MLNRRIGHYQITALLGKGGMGEVYQADDLQLGRQVAIKVLPAEFAADSSRLARLEQEARALAALNHPNVAGIHGIERDGDLRFLVMELAPGEDLSVKIARGPLPLDETLEIGRQIAAGLEEAHARGIVHRDLKPANVKVLPDGTVKILDFGLAKALDAAADDQDLPVLADSPTVMKAVTQPGVILGTAAYMSPEQARGRPVDWRTDIWALGCVLYEMLTGAAAFAGPTLTDTLAAIIEREPDLGKLPPGLPRPLRDLLRRMLAKRVGDRLQAVGDARIVLQECISGRFDEDSPSPAAATAPTRRRGPLTAGVVALLALTAVVTWWLASSRRAPAPPADESPLHLSLDLPAEYPLHYVGASPLGLEYTALDVSDDGTRLVYLTQTSGYSGLVALDLDTGKHHVLEGTADAFLPQISPDGAWVAFMAEGRLKRIPYAGGGVDILAPAPESQDLHWGRDGMLYWIERQGAAAKRMAAALNAPVETLLEPCACSRIADGTQPGEMLLDRRGELLRWRPGETPVPLAIDSPDGRGLDDGTVLFTGPGRLMAAGGLGGGSGEDSGPPRPHTVLTGLRTASNGRGQFTLSANGTLLYAAGGPASIAYLVRRGLAGDVERLPFEAASYGAVDVSPDGNRIAALVYDGSDRIQVMNVSTGTVQYVDAGPGARGPVWSPDGTRLCVSVTADSASDVIELPVDSAVSPKVLFSAGHVLYPGDWSDDGRYLALGELDGPRSWISVWDRENGELRPVTEPVAGIAWAPSFSPDGRFLSYTLVGESGSEVYVVPFPDAGKRWLVSDGNGEESQWRHDRSELVFRRGTRWYTVPYRTGNDFTFETPRLFFEGPYLNIGGIEYRVLADGSVLLLESADPARTTGSLDVVVHWDRELTSIMARP